MEEASQSTATLELKRLPNFKHLARPSKSKLDF
jgi:hypothetical protein